MSDLIMVVEDDPALRLAIQQGLTSEGYGVATVADVMEAQEVLRSEPVRAVVLDWMLRVIDGLTFCRSLKSHPTTRRLPVIMLTAKSGPDRRQEAMAAGVDVFLTKPYDLHDLLAALRRVLLGEEAGPAAGAGAGLSPGVWEPREYHVGEVLLQMPDGLVRDQTTGAVVPLRRTERWIMEVLAMHRGVVPHEELRRVAGRAWGKGPMTPGALRETVCQINRKLRQAGLPELHALRGVGYRWLAHEAAGGSAERLTKD